MVAEQQHHAYHDDYSDAPDNNNVTAQLEHFPSCPQLRCRAGPADGSAFFTHHNMRREGYRNVKLLRTTTFLGPAKSNLPMMFIGPAERKIH